MINLPNEQTENDKGELIEVDNSYWTSLYFALDRLMNNKDFQEVILKGFFRDRAANGASLLANPGIVANGERKDIFEELVSISQLQYYFQTIANLGAPAEELEDEEE